jgi:hypothetical protein
MVLAYRTAQQALFVALHILIELETSERRQSRDLEQQYTEMEAELLGSDDGADRTSRRNELLLRRLSARLHHAARRLNDDRARALVLRAAAAARKIRESFSRIGSSASRSS